MNTQNFKHNQSLVFGLVGVIILCVSPYCLGYQSDRDRDNRKNDHFGKKELQRRNRGPSRSRLPIEIQRFRTIDGTMNNVVGVNWGSAGSNLRRRVPVAYADGISSPAGTNRKPARSISNYVCNQNSSILNDRDMSGMVWQWGQFLDHDISLTESHDPLEAFPLVVPTADRYFDPFGGGGQTISFFRSHYRLGQPDTTPREQVNDITSWIDGSNVYGSDDETARSLRTMVDGLMKTSDGNLLPTDESGFFLAGDVRANEQVGLTSMHTIFVREHNRIAVRLKSLYPAMTDEQVYVRARQRVSAMIQVITYNEFIPALLGDKALSPYRGYNPFAYPNISNVFSTAAYRFGHSMLDTELLRLDSTGQVIAEGNLGLRDAFFNPANVKDFGVEPYLKGLSLQHAQEVDTKIVTDLRNFLFGGPGSGGFDLAALNIQRGRDHGLADFNSIREFYKLERYKSFDEINSELSVSFSLSQAYDTTDDIDAWVGILSEEHLPGRSVGETLFAVMKQQFELLRDGDRFWYEREFRGAELDFIRQTTLAQVIMRNSEVRNLQPNVFFVPPIR
ncbi:MAG: peroxidase family protein [Mariniblastus sp.]